MKPLRLLAAGAAAFGLLGGTAQAAHPEGKDRAFKMDEIFTSPQVKATHSDLAFWGKYAFVGYYSGDAPAGGGPAFGGVRIFDISNPAAPTEIRNFACDGPQSDPILWDRNGNGVPDLMLLAVDRTMTAPECGAPRAANHGDPNGWEGVRVFEMSDNPANPFATITQVKQVYTDCGAHTITLWPGDADEGRLLVYVSSYPLRAGPTCGDTEYQQSNPYDGDPGSPANPLHGVIQVVEVPLGNPSAARELPVQPPISYPGDPDGKIEWCERGLGCGPASPLEPAAVACHDIVVHMDSGLAAGACAEQGQIFRIGPDGLPDTASPVSISDDELTSGGTGNIPGAIDFFHSAMFNNEGTVANWVDESFGGGCPPITTYQARPWNPGGPHETGRMFFTDVGSGAFFSDFQVGDLRPDAGPGEYCSAHMGMTVPSKKRDLLVNAWYTGGVDVIDFERPTRPKEIAYYDPNRNSGTWSAYPYAGPLFKKGRGVPIYASDGVTNNAQAQGMVVYRAILPKPGSHTLDHLNPQTME